MSDRAAETCSRAKTKLCAVDGNKSGVRKEHMSFIVTLYIRSISEAHLVKWLTEKEVPVRVKTSEERQYSAGDKHHTKKTNVGSAGVCLNSSPCGQTAHTGSGNYCSVLVTRDFGQDGVDIRLARIYDSATTICEKSLSHSLHWLCRFLMF
jgi:hypothetical protein